MATHVCVWIDHNEARIFHFHPGASDHLHRDVVDETTVLAPQHHFHRHPKSQSGEVSEHPEGARAFFDQSAHALEGADAILIMGPASAKTEFFAYLREHHANVAHRVVGLETVDHPSDPQIVAIARKLFAKSDRMGL